MVVRHPGCGDARTDVLGGGECPRVYHEPGKRVEEHSVDPVHVEHRQIRHRVTRAVRCAAYQGMFVKGEECLGKGASVQRAVFKLAKTADRRRSG